MGNSFENQYDPDYVSSPGETLIEILEDRQMSQSELAGRTGRTPKNINEIIKGKTVITPDTAIQLEHVLGIPSSFWNNRQRHYDAYLAKRREENILKMNLDWAGKFPYLRMVKPGWLNATSNKVDRLKNLLGFFGVATPDAWSYVWSNVRVLYRRQESYKPDHYALAAWLRQGELIAASIDCLPYDKTKFLECLLRVKSLTRKDPAYFQKKLTEWCADCGVAVAFVPELPKTASGATRWVSPQKAIIQLSLMYKTDDHLWFTFFHEAAHILFHGKRRIFIESRIGSINADEQKADKFSAEFLIPSNRFKELLGTKPISKTAIRDFSKSVGISPGIVVGQLQHNGSLPYTHCNDLKLRLRWDYEVS